MSASIPYLHEEFPKKTIDFVIAANHTSLTGKLHRLSPVAADDLVIQVRRQALEVNVVVHEDELHLHGAAEI